MSKVSPEVILKAALYYANAMGYNDPEMFGALHDLQQERDRYKEALERIRVDRRWASRTAREALGETPST